MKGWSSGAFSSRGEVTLWIAEWDGDNGRPAGPDLASAAASESAHSHEALESGDVDGELAMVHHRESTARGQLARQRTLNQVRSSCSPNFRSASWDRLHADRFECVTSPSSSTGELRLGHLMVAAGVELNEVVVLRHTYTEDGLRVANDLTAEKVLSYTRRQVTKNKLGPEPERYWLVFMAAGGRRSRLLTVYENHGEVPRERVGNMRYFDLRPSELMSALVGRLVVEWPKDAVNWVRRARAAAALPVVEIADPEVVPFPGFDRLLINYTELQEVVSSSRYSDWRVALASVQGIYLIADNSTGQLYIGKADGAERILGRWMAYARDGHGGNIALRGLSEVDATHAQHFLFSILRVFGPSTPATEVDRAESHFKDALLARQFGLNRN